MLLLGLLVIVLLLRMLVGMLLAGRSSSAG